MENHDLNKTSYVDDMAQVEKGCLIGKRCRISGKIRLASHSQIGDNTIIYGPAIIGKETYIGPNCLLGHPDRKRLKEKISSRKESEMNNKSDNLVIGEECIIRSGSVIYTNVELGRHAELGHNAMIREKVRIGDNTIVGTNAVIDGLSNIGMNVSIQSGVYICINSTVEDAVFLGPYCVFTNDKFAMQKETRLLGPTIRRGASIGANATLMAGITVGEGAVVGAGAMVNKDVPARTIYAGIPAKIVKPLPSDWRPLLEKGIKRE